jgi:hypothetical protein
MTIAIFGKGGSLDHRSRKQRRQKSGPEKQPAEDAIKDTTRDVWTLFS